VGLLLCNTTHIAALLGYYCVTAALLLRYSCVTPALLLRYSCGTARPFKASADAGNDSVIFVSQVYPMSIAARGHSPLRLSVAHSAIDHPPLGHLILPVSLTVRYDCVTSVADRVLFTQKHASSRPPGRLRPTQATFSEHPANI